MCNAWNDRKSIVADEAAFMLPFDKNMQMITRSFINVYRYQCIAIFKEWLNQDVYVEIDSQYSYRSHQTLKERYDEVVERAKSILKRLDEWVVQYVNLERTEISGAEYWHIVKLMEELIDTMDDNTEYNFVKMQKYASKTYQYALQQAMDRGGRDFDNFRDDVIKVLHTSIDMQRRDAL